MNLFGRKFPHLRFTILGKECSAVAQSNLPVSHNCSFLSSTLLFWCWLFHLDFFDIENWPFGSFWWSYPELCFHDMGRRARLTVSTYIWHVPSWNLVVAQPPLLQVKLLLNLHLCFRYLCWPSPKARRVAGHCGQVGRTVGGSFAKQGKEKNYRVKTWSSWNPTWQRKISSFFRWNKLLVKS